MTDISMHGTHDHDLSRHEHRLAPLSDCPVLAGNAVTLLTSGADTLAAMLEDIAAARDHIHLEYYIFDDVRAGGRSLVDLLVAAAARGVQVAAIYDAVGSLHTPDAVIARLEQAGVKTLEFRPLNPLRRHFAWHLNDRDHRKILVVDGRVAYLGGVNLARIYENPPSAGVMPDSKNLSGMIAPFVLPGRPLPGHSAYFCKPGTGMAATSWMRGISSPRYRRTVCTRCALPRSAPLEKQQLYFRALHEAVAEAKERILLSTGYFVPARRDWKILADAARRGVAVNLVLGGHSDLPAALHAGRALYGRLLEAGVRIHEVQDGLVHAKAATIDGVWSAVGSSNFDRRSYQFNNEVDAVLLGRDMAAELEAMLRGWAARATEVTLTEWRRRSWNERGQEYLARLWERYM